MATAEVDAREEVSRLRGVNAALVERTRQLQEALDSRVVIEQAKGMLAERYELSIDEAFDLLRGAARKNRVKLRALAAWVVSSPATPPIVAARVARRTDRIG